MNDARRMQQLAGLINESDVTEAQKMSPRTPSEKLSNDPKTLRAFAKFMAKSEAGKTGNSPDGDYQEMIKILMKVLTKKEAENLLSKY